MPTYDQMIADKIERDPSLLRIPLENIDRWLARGHTAPHRLEQWRGLIEAAQSSKSGMDRLLHLLRSEEQDAVRLREFAPLAGILNRQERLQAEPECVWNF